MRMSFFVSCLLILAGVFLGCQTAEKEAAAASSNSGEVIQYRGVCMATDVHGGNEYVLTKWLDDKNKVLVYTKEHERKNKSHIVEIQERVKPAKDESQSQ